MFFLAEVFYAIMLQKNTWEFDMDGSEKRRRILLRLMAEREISNQDLAEASGLHEVSISRYLPQSIRADINHLYDPTLSLSA